MQLVQLGRWEEWSAGRQKSQMEGAIVVVEVSVES